MPALLTGWGRYPAAECNVVRPENVADLAPGMFGNGHGCIARGLGRAYGDAALNGGGEVILTERLDRVVHWDRHEGRITVEAGMSLGELLALIVPRYFLWVLPGTQHVTVGGAIAADIHGKNHHVHGTFGDHVESLVLRLADGTRHQVSRSDDAPLFWATLGGMGLTGIIEQATLNLRPIETDQLRVTCDVTADLDGTVKALLADSPSEEYRVVWLDALAKGSRLGRGQVLGGTHASLAEVEQARRSPAPRLRAGVPFVPPITPLSNVTIALHNAARFWSSKLLPGAALQHYEPFFFPLDVLDSWNRLYGPRGFVQYQITVPLTVDATAHVLEHLHAAGCPPYLVVLKDFGAHNQGHLSFPHRSFTLAMDIPVTDRLLPALDALDEWVLAQQGRVYLAKDARLRPEMFRAMYPRLDEWLEIKHRVDPSGRFASDLSRRLGLT